ncbi:ATP-binding cassette sub-family C member 3 isoform X2 [Rhipicephalus microplus]|uniref:ATP-binding cassette sub-family C member 3 isoform X2 n=1 Tax=Rhipicephalus microplus TaxID=6941 RepID=UPI003F6B73B5
MNSFCGSPLWDNSLTWDAETPDFTPCFQETVLVWVPCLFLWLTCPFDVVAFKRSRNPPLPWTFLNIAKVLLSVVLIVTSAVEIAQALTRYADGHIVFPVEYYAPVARMVTFLLAVVLMTTARRRGVCTSGPLFIFWLLMSLASIVRYRSVILQVFSEDVGSTSDEQMEFRFVTIVVYCPVIVGQFLLSCFADTAQPVGGGKKAIKQCPESRASFLSKLLFWWFNSMAIMGFKRPLQMHNMWFLDQSNQTAKIAEDFSHHFEKEKQKRGMLIAFVSSDDPLWRGLLFAFTMFFSAMLESILNGQYDYRIYVISMRMRSAMINAIYKKALALSSVARGQYTTGEIVNLMSVDTQRVMDYIQVYNLIWITPLQIGLAIWLLWGQLGIATLGGLGVMIILLPINGVVTAYIRKYQVQLMKHKDRRLKLMNEILGGIKVLKLYAWEKSFQQRVQDIRDDEMKSLKVQAYLSAAVIFAFTCAPFLVALASFAVFIAIDTNNILDANKAFVSLSLFNILRVPMAFLPMLITFTAMFFVSLGRINKYLRSDELDPNAVQHNTSEGNPLVIKDASFAWEKHAQPTLDDLNISVPTGALAAVVGSVGSGKSSMLSAFLGDMVKLKGTVNINGSVAYCPQQAWIQNASVKSNITFGQPFDRDRYEQVIEACALKQDLDILPGGDDTEVGEKGINLSGGQKQRISLARAVYSGSSIYFFDDPLSAVDSHVGKHIFDKVIGPKGLLRKKTRLLVTHRLSVLPQVDMVIVLSDGKISDVGTYDELLTRGGAFSDFLVQFLQEGEETEGVSDEDMQLLGEIVSQVGASTELARQYSRLSANESDSTSDTERRARRRRTSSTRSAAEKSIVQSKVKPEKTPPVAAGAKLTEEESAQVGSVKWWVYLAYIKAMGKWLTALTFVSYVFSHAFNIMGSYWLSLWSNDALDPVLATDPQQRNFRLGMYAMYGIVETMFILVGSISLNLAALRGSKILHAGMLDRVLCSPMSFFDTTPMGRILNRFSKDIDTADVTLRFNLRMLMMQFFRTVVSFILISMENPIFLAAVIPLLIIYYFVQKFYIATSRQLKRLESISRSPIYVHFSETVSGSSSIRAYGAGERFVARSNELTDINHSSFFPSIAASRWLSIRLEFLGYSIVFIAALLAVLTRETLSPGLAGLSVSYALTVTSTLNMLVRATSDTETNLVAVERCFEYTRTPQEAPWERPDFKPDDRWPTAGRVVYDNYSTRYRNDLELVLKGISCDINPGEKIGIVGRTGAGKSSLTLSLFRLIEAAGGAICIDGMDISYLGLYDLRSKLTIIPQDPVLFSGTLRSNLDPFDSMKDDELWRALEHSHLKEYVAGLEKGLEHIITEGGENISVGQRQLVCLARALLRKSRILILDEATAAVDMETDDLIQATIRREFADCTIITIAHRLNTVLDYDRIMVLDRGQIVEFDAPRDLLKQETSVFYQLAKDANLV